MNGLTGSVWDQWLLVSHQMPVTVLVTAKLVPGRRPCRALPALCRALGEGGQLLRCQSRWWYRFSAAGAFSPLLWCGVFCDASAAHVGHSLTAGCASSRGGKRQSRVCGEHLRVSLPCPSSMAFLKLRGSSGALRSPCLLRCCVS